MTRDEPLFFQTVNDTDDGTEVDSYLNQKLIVVINYIENTAFRTISPYKKKITLRFSKHKFFNYRVLEVICSIRCGNEAYW